MSGKIALDMGKAAVLIMDYQNKQIQNQPEQKRDILVKNARSVLDAARSLKLVAVAGRL